MMIFYVARKIKAKWNISHIIHMPDNSCLATASSMAHAAGVIDKNLKNEVVRDNIFSQKNVIPANDNLPVILYNAQQYWEYKLSQAKIIGEFSVERCLEAAAKDGILLKD